MHCEITVEGIIAGNLKLGNYRPEDAWECLRRESKERKFALMIKVIYQSQFSLRANCHSKIHVVGNNKHRELA